MTRRFWTDVDVSDGIILLDGRPVRTPARAPLVLPTAMLADAIACEWRMVDDVVDPRRMPLTGLANAAIDRIAPDTARVAEGILRYAETDLTCYRADGPADLVVRQAETWDPLLAVVRDRFGASLVVTTGIVAIAQPRDAIDRLAAVVTALGAFELAGLSRSTSLSGSLVIGLALLAGDIDAERGWRAAELDELHHAERWGDDPIAVAARADKRAAFDGAVRFLALSQEREPA